MIHLLDEMKIEILPAPPSPTAECVSTSTGIACKNCGFRIAPVVMNGKMSPTAWTHLHKRFGYGAGCWCDDGGKAEPLVEEL